jgi:dTDP-4-dehydrorhamnose reductase
MRIFVLGATGMLGHRVAEQLSEDGLDVVKVSRTSGTQFDFEASDFTRFSELTDLREEDWVINCIGWIPQKASGDHEFDKRRAYRLNASLLRQIQEEQGKLNFAWLQIGTDCVFDGENGNYVESSEKRATDLYSETKIEGETYTKRAVQIRASIIGMDRTSNSGLFEWFESLPFGASVKGYTNHFWNGVTTNAFAKLASGLVQTNKREPRFQHWVPLGHASKYELLLIFKKHLGRDDVGVIPVERSRKVDRRLSSSNTEANSELWEIAGYSRPQTIEELVSEMIFEDPGERVTK